MLWRGLLFGAARVLALIVGATAYAVDVTGASARSSAGLEITAVVAVVVFVALTIFREAELFLSSRPDMRFIDSAPASNDVRITFWVKGANTKNATKYDRDVEAHFVRCQFENVSPRENDNATARKLTARIRVLGSNRSWLGRWSHTDHPASPSDIWSLNETEAAPNGQRPILDIGARYVGQSEYAPGDFVPWYNEILLRNKHTPNPPIKIERFEIEVELKAANMGPRRWRFRIENPPAPKDTAVLTHWARRRLWWWQWRPIQGAVAINS